MIIIEVQDVAGESISLDVSKVLAESEIFKKSNQCEDNDCDKAHSVEPLHC